MFSFDNSFFIYIFIVASLLLIGLFFWRKMHGLQTQGKILENKLKTLKKENFELQKALAEDKQNITTMSDADIIMSQVFEVQTKDLPTMTSFTCNEDKCSIQEIPEVQHVVQHVVENDKDDEKPISDDIPVAKHEESIVEGDVESIMSENTNVYNRKKLAKLNLDKIKDIAASMELSTEGTKNIIIDRILSQ